MNGGELVVWREPRVAVIGRPVFTEPEWLKVDWVGEDATDAEKLVEYAGRVCYMSQHNPAHRTTGEYVQDVIIARKHGSVIEHATFTLLLEGVSRSLSLELIRHRAGTAVSQLSQRFVEGAGGVVIPPAILELPETAIIRWAARAQRSVALYLEQLADLKLILPPGKKLREAARSLRPECTETKLVFTANLRAWRHMIEMRTAEGADAEIRRLFFAVLAVLRVEAPSAFSDFREDGVPLWSKV